MGSYNVSCSLSGLSIGPGAPAVVILMESGQYGSQDSEHSASLNFPPKEYIYPSEGVTSCVIPPIRGTYEDYGDLEFTEEDNPHLKHLVNHNINWLLHPYRDEEPTKADKEKFPEGLFAVWIHGEVYDHMLSWYKANIETASTVWPTRGLLRELGFIEGEQLKYLERYQYLHTHPQWENVAIAADSQCFARLVLRDGNKWKFGPSTCTMKDIVKYATDNNLPLAYDEVRPRLHLIQLQEQIREAGSEIAYQREVIKIAKERIARNEFNDDEHRIWCEKRANKPFRYTSTYWGFIAGSRAVYKNFTSLWAQLLIDNNPDVMSVVADLQAISSCFYASGRLMIPTHGGPQCGEYSFSRELGDITAKVARKALEERDY